MKELSDQEVLQAAIQKAIDGGWNSSFNWPLPALWAVDEGGIYSVHDGYEKDEVSLEEIIFNHEFCKALWGEDLVFINKGCAIEDPYDEDEEVNLSPYWRTHLLNSWTYDIPVWAFHLTKMVVAEDKIDYLRRHL